MKDLATAYRECSGNLSALLDVADELAEYLTESHQNEIDRNHYGAGPDDCAVCAALAEFKETRATLLGGESESEMERRTR